ncbi:MAG: cysteine desulfurase [Pirellulaceae bacterium]|nr:cysteine desulfurase [Pirellulaceae bacterium]
MRTIYLDYNTSTPIAGSVRDAMLPFLSEFYAHPSNSHWQGRAVQEAIEDSRSHLGSLLGCHPSELVFTSGGTESVNLAIIGVARAVAIQEPDLIPHMITSSLEHPCVLRCADELEARGWQVTFIGSDAQGIVRLEELEDAMRENTRLVSLIHASHLLGTIQPIASVAELCQEHRALLHVDAAQTVGKIPVNVDELGIDLLSLSGHKFYAPKGIGALYVRMGVTIQPILFGEGNEGGLRPGTENISHIAALGQAAKLVGQGMELASDRLSELRDRFHTQLEQLLATPLLIHGARAPRLPHCLSFELPGMEAAALEQRIPEICLMPAPTGSYRHGRGRVCSTYASIGLSADEASRTLRVSFGWNTTEEEVDRACQLIAAAYEGLAP